LLEPLGVEDGEDIPEVVVRGRAIFERKRGRGNTLESRAA